MDKKKIIIIDDEPMISYLIKELFEEESDLEVSAIVSTSSDLFERLSQTTFDLALLDISVGEREGGLGILRELQSRSISLPVIMLSAHGEWDYALKCLSNGAKGYISKNNILSELSTGAREVLNGGLFISGEHGKMLLDEYTRTLNKN